MKKIIRVLALALCLMITMPVVELSTGIETVEAATKVKLNCTKKTIYEGDSFKLKVTGTKKKVKWSSSNKNVATVSYKGVVKGIKGGTSKRTCKITASVGGKKYTCKVTVKKLKAKSRVEYINNRSVEYVKTDNVERFFFGLCNQYKDAISAHGNVDLRIENNGVIVYNKTVKFTSKNFGYWANVYGERYLCSIDIPIADITPGKNSDGVLYYKVYGDNISFDEYSLKIYNLPKEQRKIEVDTNSYIVDSYTPENKAQLIKYNVNDNKIYLTYKMVQVGEPNRGNFGAYIYQYDKNGNILDDIYVYTSNLTTGSTFTNYAYLEDETVRIGISTNIISSNENNDSSNTTNNPTRSVSENISLLKQYISKNGVTNTDGNKCIKYTSSSQTSGIVYMVQSGELNFVTTSGESGVIMKMTSSNNTSSMQVDYVLYRNGIGITATGYVNPTTYSLNSDVRFSITNTTAHLTDDEIQDVCNAELRVGFTGWQIVLYDNLRMSLKDIGFISYSD